MTFTSVEICTGAGGQALGLEHAGFEHVAVAEIDPDACNTLRLNRPRWKVIEDDIRNLSGHQFDGIDLFAGGVPCPPFSVAGKQLGADDERNLFPQALRLIGEIKPRAVLLENVKGLAGPRFTEYREWLYRQLAALGYLTGASIVQASDYGVPQLRPRFIIIGFREERNGHQWMWPVKHKQPTLTVGDVLYHPMAERNWPGAMHWALGANRIAPTIVGGSKKHGGPDLGPTRARAEWLKLGVTGTSLADEAPGPDFPIDGYPRLTLGMVKRLQAIPATWHVMGGKTAAYRQIGNALPPPVARELGTAIMTALR